VKHSLYLSEAESERGIVRNPKAHGPDSPSQNDPPITSFRHRDNGTMYVSCRTETMSAASYLTQRLGYWAARCRHIQEVTR